MTCFMSHFHRDDCHCTECNEKRVEAEREAAAELARTHRTDDVSWDDDRLAQED